MGHIRLGYEPMKKIWVELPKSDATEYNGHKIVVIDAYLWKKVQNVIKIKKKGYDAIIIIDGKKRTGKSTLAQTIGYLLDPHLSINNFVKGLEDAPNALERVEDESVLIFDEGSLVFNSKDARAKANVQLLKIIDVIGQKRLAMIICLPMFFDLNRQIAKDYSIFLIHVYTDRQLNRGRYTYFGTSKKRTLYDLGKKMGGSYRKPGADFIGRFIDFKLDFNEEYLKLKKESLRQSFGHKQKEFDGDQRREFIIKCLENLRSRNLNITLRDLAAIFEMGERSITTYKAIAKENAQKAAVR